MRRFEDPEHLSSKPVLDLEVAASVNIARFDIYKIDLDDNDRLSIMWKDARDNELRQTVFQGEKINLPLALHSQLLQLQPGLLTYELDSKNCKLTFQGAEVTLDDPRKLSEKKVARLLYEDLIPIERFDSDRSPSPG
jgi:hypothetical protein